jgi:hypothetical protein
MPLHYVSFTFHQFRICFRYILCKSMRTYLYYAGHTQKTGAISRVDKKIYFSPYMGSTYTGNSGLPAVRFSCLLWGHGTSLQDGFTPGDGFLCASFWGVKILITLQREFDALFKKDIFLVWCVFFKPCMKLLLHVNHRSGHLKMDHTGSFLPLWRHLANWSRGSVVRMRSELRVVHEKLGQFTLLPVYVVLL